MGARTSVERFELIFDLLQRRLERRAPVSMRGALVENVLPLHLQIAPLAFACRVFDRRLHGADRLLRHLLFHRFAFPSSCHDSMLRRTALFW